MLDFPTRAPVPVEMSAELAEALGLPPVDVWATPREWLVVYETEHDVRVLDPDMDLLSAFGCDLAQGYHIARPMPPADIPTWIERSSWRMAES